MRVLVESYRRLYRAGRLTKDQLLERYESRQLTRDEYDYIVAD